MPTIKIKVLNQEKMDFLRELLSSFDFISFEEDENHSSEKILSDIETGYQEVQEIEKGKAEGVSLNSFLDEL